ncbi:unnamed protein product [Brachionus calyciflorus]|uniref:Uncharacterized protein n=1 Tax=Brachionus calyciflorus TaxID=104777 RepID=A0A813PHS6_9BILA|nr:unnamed protein product [Brachionus calyciflorus]
MKLIVGFLQKKKLFYLFVVISTLIILISNFINLKLYKISDTILNNLKKPLKSHSSNELINKYSISNLVVMENNCDSIWIKFNQYVYFRKNLAFYFYDLKRFEIYYERHFDHKYNFTFLVEFNDEIIELTNITRTEMHAHHVYIFDLLSANFTSEKINPNTKMSIYIKSLNQTIKIENLIIKKFNESNENKEKSLLCSKVYYFDDKYAKIFEWWIEINRRNGFDKLVFFNNSLPKEFDFLKEKYSNFVDIIQYECIPNFIDPNNKSIPFLKSFKDLKTFYNIDPLYYHMHFEYLTQNECFLTYIDKYIQIAILDQDETVLQRKLSKSLHLNYEHIGEDEFKNDQECSSQSLNIYDYLLQLKERVKKVKNLDYLKNTTDISYHFLMGLYIKFPLIEQLFAKLDNFTKTNKVYNNFSFYLEDENDFNFRGHKGVKFKVLIDSEKAFNYAINLQNIFNNSIKPFLVENKNLISEIPETFNRVFFVDGDTTSWMCGKSIHNSKNTHWVQTHYPDKTDFNNFVWSTHELGHVSHFRESLKDLHERNVSILNFHFDLNYFLCYLQPIAKTMHTQNLK